MQGILVDTSVWVGHFRRSDPVLVGWLVQDRVMTHPLIIGEIACGTPPNRSQTLADLQGLHQVQQASLAEVMAFIEREGLFGTGCGLVDMLLLSSTLITPGAVLWTLDTRLHTLAERFGVAFDPGAQ